MMMPIMIFRTFSVFCCCYCVGFGFNFLFLLLAYDGNEKENENLLVLLAEMKGGKPQSDFPLKAGLYWEIMLHSSET
jgi:hypothetical protein